MDIFKIVKDSQKMEKWNDSLGRMVDAVDKKYSKSKLSDEELFMVAGGVAVDKEPEPDEKEEEKLTPKISQARYRF